MSLKQQTLKAPITFSGKGLHTGVHVTMTVKPAGIDNGIVFRRIDIEGQPTIPALCDYVVDTSRGTTIEKDGHRVCTIEHILSTLWTLGVDNAEIDIDASETPIMDGSAREYAQTVVATGLEAQEAERKYYQVTEKMVYTIPEKGVAIIMYPDDDFSVSLHVDYNSKIIGNQYATFNPEDNFATKIAPCRTFVFLHELEPLMQMNLIKGGDLDNAIVVVENPVPDEQLAHLKKIFNKPDIHITGGYLNNLELRFNNELARHKLLDLLGDFALLGVRINGRVWATKPGHFANTEFMKQTKRTIRKEGERPRYKYDCRQPALYDIIGIRRMLPHRPPFLLVDRIFHRDAQSVAGIKNVTMNEPFFVGHFPEEPVMPGVLIVEAMAQCSGILVLGTVPDPEHYSTYFLKIDGVKFKRKVVPGDTLQFEIHLLEPIRRGLAIVEGKAFVGETLACEAVMMAQIVKNKTEKTNDL
ncbi:MAG: bifunctional UDP-3-O-[3-hydroxymyristoyl] N-acetylglucosamine deacetylase/3-hydroxyacyl-ACP dehydratase [Alistipes sp.]